jgi:beta-ribofuranosylaminobenzene 5'-phosphate synthase
MLIEVVGPASFALGMVKLRREGGQRLACLGVSLKHPPMHVRAQAAPTLSITGPRAKLAHEFAQRLFAYHSRPAQGQVEIELGIARAMGLGSQPALALCTLRALAWANDMPYEDAPALAEAAGLSPDQALAFWAFQRGGLLLVEAEASKPGGLPGVLRRHELAHEDNQAWVFVFYLPLTSADTPPNMEAARLAAMREAGPYLSSDTGRLLDEVLWPALARDDLPSFAEGLMQLRALNQEALAMAGTAPAVSGEAEQLLELMREHGALAWGQAAAGQALFGLLRGAPASIALRRALSERLGLFAGTVMAAITDNQGATHTIKHEDLQDVKATPPVVRP